MKKLLSILFALISFSAFAQPGSLKISGVFVRVQDSSAYESAAATAHSQGYADIFYNEQSPTPHFKIWNGSSYTHVFDFNAGGGGTPTLQQVITAGSVLTGNNEITGPRNTSIQVGDETTGGIHGIEAMSDQVVLKSDTFYIQDIAGGNTIYSDNGIDESGIARGGDGIVFNGATGITLTTDNTDGIKVSGGGTLAQTSGLLTKAQVGDYITSRQFKKSVKASSTANIADLNNAGASMDGITLATQDRVLLKDQSTGSQNGIYNVVSLTPTVLTRVGDFSSSTFEGVLTNTLVLVDQGTTNGGKAYRLSTTGTITIGTTALTFTEFGVVVDAINDGVTTSAPSQNAVFDALALKAQLYPSTRTETASTTGVLADAGGYVEINSASATTFTVPPASSVAYSDNTTITIHNYGAGDITVTAGSGVTFRLRSGATLTVPQYSVAVVKKKTGDEWYVWSGAVPLNSTTLTNTRIPYADVNNQLTDRAGFEMVNGKMTVDRIQLAAGTTTAGTAPLAFTSGPLMTTAEVGKMEFLTDKFYATITTGAARKELTLNDAALTSGTFPVATTNGRITNSTFTTTNLVAGTYTPTLTNVANLDASTAFQCTYLRVGNTVTVSGRVDIDPTAATTSTQLGISLPVASAITTANQCGGTAASPTIVSQSAAIMSDATNDRAQLEYISTDTTNQPMYFTFTYQVL